MSGGCEEADWKVWESSVEGIGILTRWCGETV